MKPLATEVAPLRATDDLLDTLIAISFAAAGKDLQAHPCVGCGVPIHRGKRCSDCEAERLELEEEPYTRSDYNADDADSKYGCES